MKTRMFVLFLLIVAGRLFADSAGWTNYTVGNSDLQSDDIVAVYKDTQGNVWVGYGSAGYGVSKFDGTTWTTYTTADGLPFNYVYCIEEDNRGNIWIGFGYWSPGVCMYDGATWWYYNTEDGLAGNMVFDIDKDSAGNIWISSYVGGLGPHQGGVTKYDGYRFTAYTSPDTMQHHKVEAIGCDYDGNVWVGMNWGATMVSGGATKFNGTDWVNYNTTDGLASDWVTSIATYSKPDKAVWFGTYGGGVGEYDGTDWEKHTTGDGVGHNDVGDLDLDNRGDLWVATLGGGVSRYDGTIWTTWTTAGEQLSSDVTTAIDAASDGNVSTVWIGTQGGGLCKLVFTDDSPAVLGPETDTYKYTKETTFWVNIEVDNVTDLFGASFVLEFDQTDYVSVVERTFTFVPIQAGSFLGSGSDVLLYAPEESDTGKVNIGMSRKASAGSGVDGSGTVVKVAFEFSEDTPIGTQVTFSLSEVVCRNYSASVIDMNSSIAQVHVTAVGDSISVWPGDADNDNDVDQDDILPIGLNWHESCPVRNLPSTHWHEQKSPPSLQPDVVRADCDGSGYVDQGDLLPVGLNWNKSHTLLASVENAASFATSAGLDANALRTGLVKSGQDGSLYELSINLAPEFLSAVMGVSFAASGLEGTEILDVEKGELWSSEALFLSMPADGGWGVGITEITAGSFRSASGTCLVKIIFRPGDTNIDPGSLISITDLKLSLASGEVIDLESPLLMGGGQDRASLPKASALCQNSPNPFNPSTTIAYSVAEGGLSISLKVFNLRGKLVHTLVDEVSQAGNHSVSWNGADERGAQVSSGVYFYRMRLGDKSITRKMVLMK